MTKEIKEFIEELIENQVLMSELEPNVTGIDFLQLIIFSVYYSMLKFINFPKWSE